MKTFFNDIKKEIMDKIESRNTETEKNINENINVIRNEVKNNSDKIDDLTARIERIEKEKENNTGTYADAVKKDPIEKVKEDTFKEARKIVGLLPITNSDIKHYIKMGKDEDIALLDAVNDFLKLEMKLSTEEIKDLKIKNITRPQKDEVDRVYLHLEDEEGSKYLYRKVSQVNNTEIKISPFIPPQVFKRFSELSRLTFIARKNDINLKTQIRLGEKDIFLLTRHKDSKEWNLTDVNRFGKIPEMEWYKNWPTKKMPIIDSPPHGRTYRHKNIHNLSRSSDEEPTPKKDKKSVSNIAEYFERRDLIKSKKDKKK